MATKSSGSGLSALPVRFIAGKRYGGSGQLYLSYVDDESLFERAKKFTDRSRGQHKPLDGAKAATFEKIRKLKTAIITGNKSIRWEKENEERYITINRPELLRILRKRMCNPLFSYSHLYRIMIGGLRDPKFETFVRLHLIATGIGPERVETYIKLKGRGVTFILPESFMRDCRDAFLHQDFR